MEFTYHGANCVEITAKQGNVVIDAALSVDGLKDVKAKDAIYVATQAGLQPKGIEAITVEGPGEYEVKDISVKGIPANRMIDGDNSRQSTLYRMVFGDVVVAVVGHVMSPLSDEQLEALGVIDVAIVPVGGGGYTLDGHQAVTIVRQLDPKVVIPTHFADPAITYEVQQNSLEEFTKELSAIVEPVQAKFKIKNGVLPEALTVVELSRV